MFVAVGAVQEPLDVAPGASRTFQVPLPASTQPGDRIHIFWSGTGLTSAGQFGGSSVTMPGTWFASAYQATGSARIFEKFYEDGDPVPEVTVFRNSVAGIGVVGQFAVAGVARGVPGETPWGSTQLNSAVTTAPHNRPANSWTGTDETTWYFGRFRGHATWVPPATVSGDGDWIEVIEHTRFDSASRWNQWHLYYLEVIEGVDLPIIFDGYVWTYVPAGTAFSFLANHGLGLRPPPVVEPIIAAQQLPHRPLVGVRPLPYEVRDNMLNVDERHILGILS